MLSGAAKVMNTCTAEVIPDDKGGINVHVRVPGYESVATFSICVERNADNTWVVSLPWDEDTPEQSRIIEGGYECVGGLVYIGAPE